MTSLQNLQETAVRDLTERGGLVLTKSEARRIITGLITAALQEALRKVHIELPYPGEPGELWLSGWKKHEAETIQGITSLFPTN